MSTIKSNLAKWAGILGTLAMVGIIIYFAFRMLPDAKKTMGVKSSDGVYTAEVKAAMDAWNTWSGCTFLIPGDDILVESDGGEPCGDMIRPKHEEGHAATAYRCGEHYQIVVAKPGHTNSAAHYIGHEIGHVLKRPHHTIGFMGKTLDPNSGQQNILKINDADRFATRKEFCR